MSEKYWRLQGQGSLDAALFLARCTQQSLSAHLVVKATIVLEGGDLGVVKGVGGPAAHHRADALVELHADAAGDTLVGLVNHGLRDIAKRACEQQWGQQFANRRQLSQKTSREGRISATLSPGVSVTWRAMRSGEYQKPL